HLLLLADRADLPARILSGGMQRRLNLACALVHEPDVLLLDEPTVGLDAAAREAVYGVLQTLKSRGVAMILTSHHMDEVAQVCDTMGIMERGRLVQKSEVQRASTVDSERRVAA